MSNFYWEDGLLYRENSVHNDPRYNTSTCVTHGGFMTNDQSLIILTSSIRATTHFSNARNASQGAIPVYKERSESDG